MTGTFHACMRTVANILDAKHLLFCDRLLRTIKMVIIELNKIQLLSKKKTKSVH